MTAELRAVSCLTIKFPNQCTFFTGVIATAAALMISCSLHKFSLPRTHTYLHAECSHYLPSLFVSDAAASVLGAAPGHSSAHRRSLHVHLRSTISGDTSSPHRRLEPADQVSAAPRFRHLRVPDLDYATHEPFRASERNR